MSKQLITEDVLESPEGIEVMGLTPSNYLFKGVTTGKVNSCGSGCIASMEVKGELFGECSLGSFTSKIVIGRLKHFDEDLFNKMLNSMLKYTTSIKMSETAMENAESHFKELENLLE